MKTEAKGFYLDIGEEKLSGFGDISKKSTEGGSVGSNKQLPFLVYSQHPSGDDSNRNNPVVGRSKGKKTLNATSQKQAFTIKQIAHK